MSAFREFAEEVRKIVRDGAERHAPAIERYRVVSRKPLTLEAFGSEDRLLDGEGGFEATGIRQRAKANDTVIVATDRHGDKVAFGLLRSAEEEEAEGGEGAVTSVFGRTGAVSAKAGDYTVAEITGAAAQAELEAEESARKGADATEKAAREAADNAEATARETADSSEAGARAAADGELSEAITNESTAREAGDADSLGVVLHGSNAATARPTGHDNYIWVGTVVPENMAEDDLLAKHE